MPQSSENRALNLLRFGAALLVVFAHLRLFFFRDYADVSDTIANRLIYAFSSVGSEAVIVFFVLSGFWVGGSVWRRARADRFQWGSYANARLTRLWIVLIPALALTLLIDSAGRIAFPAADQYAATAQYAGVDPVPDYGIPTLLGNIVFIQDIYVQPFGMNHPLWSLSYEFWYYAIFPVVALAVAGTRTWWRRALWAFLAIAMAIFVGTDVLLLFPAWIAGAVVGANQAKIAQVLKKVPPKLLALTRATLMLILIGAALAHHQVDVPYKLDSLLLGVITAVFAATLITDIRLPGTFDRGLTVASNAAHWSYSLYAIHMPLTVIASAAIVPSYDSRWPMDGVHILFGLGVVVGLCFVSWLFARATEYNTDRVRGAVSVLTSRRHATATEPAGPR